MRRMIAMVVAVWCCLDGGPLLGADPTLVSTRQGPVTGEALEGVQAYKGIPFAAPPVGERRWKPPQPAQAWTDPRPCRDFGPACPQPAAAGLTQITARTDEDCLYLNIWTGKLGAAARQPVMVWFHGGGFVQGAASQSVYDGAALARRGVVVVSVTYRLGALGFLAHPLLTAESPQKVSGNYGMLDQVQALEWVRDNIAGFGGDPGNVTIFGQSAGGVSVCALMASPLTQGLFHRAIVHSGGAPRRLRHLDRSEGRLESAHDAGVQLARKLGIPDGPEALTRLRAKPAHEIVQAQRGIGALPGTSAVDNLIVDGWFLKESPGEAFAAGRQHPVPLLAGSTADEGTMFTSRGRVGTLSAYRIFVRAVFAAEAEQALALYPARDDISARQAFTDMVGDSFVVSARRVVRDHSRAQPATWLYHFTRTPAYAARRGLGCFHGAELPYVLGHMPERLAYTPEDRALAAAMQAAWVRFAATGDPNGPDLPAWPRYTAEKDQHLQFDVNVQVGSGLRRERCDLMDTVGERFRE